MSIVLQQSFEVENCYSCGVAFAMPSDLNKTLRQTHRTFYCPNGHQQSYMSETEAERLKRELTQEQNCRAMVAARLMAAQQETAKLQKRISAGACPCCKRNFSNLHQHMKTKHKDYGTPTKALESGARRIA